MLARLPRLTLVRLWAALLLAAIGLQAAAPAPAEALEPTHGSAFSANTYEVALFVQRGDRAARQAVAPMASVPLGPRATAVRPQPEILADAPAPRPDSTGPPLREIGSWQPAPRAPPAS
jgi:hypothetical protein